MAKVKHIHEEYPKHDWLLDENGEIDMWAWYNDDTGYGGPKCRRCNEMPFLFFYEEEKLNLNPCIIDKYLCPKCNYNDIRRFGLNYHYCPMCGESLDWSKAYE